LLQTNAPFSQAEQEIEVVLSTADLKVFFIMTQRPCGLPNIKVHQKALPRVVGRNDEVSQSV